jgi:hypothetical protein
MIKMIGFKPQEGKYEIIECEEKDTYRTMRDFIGNIIEPRDIIVNEEEGSVISMYVDEEGLLKDNPIVSVIDHAHRPILVGNVVVAKINAEGETVTLTETEIERITASTVLQLLDLSGRGQHTHCICLDRENNYYAQD